MKAVSGSFSASKRSLLMLRKHSAHTPPADGWDFSFDLGVGRKLMFPMHEFSFFLGVTSPTTVCENIGFCLKALQMLQ
jgi:hypothetical protein